VWGRENLGPNFWQIYQVLHQSSHIFGRPLWPPIDILKMSLLFGIGNLWKIQ
jgi:hypothetical protein